MNGHQNPTGFPLTKPDLLAFNLFLVGEAHKRGLAIGLKNGLVSGGCGWAEGRRRGGGGEAVVGRRARRQAQWHVLLDARSPSRWHPESGSAKHREGAT